MDPNWCLISEILITLHIYNSGYVINSENFPEFCSEELHNNLSFLMEIGLVDSTGNSSDKECAMPHTLTNDGEKVTEKVMDDYYAQLS